VASEPTLLFDANVLYPFHLRNLLVQLAVDGLITARWTDTIHAEWIDSLAATGTVTRERLLRTRDIMNRVLPDAMVCGYEQRIAGLSLPDPADCHVLAAAIEAQATILTFNLRDFPVAALAPFGLTARDPDDVLCALYHDDAEAVTSVVEAARLNLRVTTPTRARFVQALAGQRLSVFVAGLRQAGYEDEPLGQA
jgi:PIN domain